MAEHSGADNVHTRKIAEFVSASATSRFQTTYGSA